MGGLHTLAHESHCHEDDPSHLLMVVAILERECEEVSTPPARAARERHGTDGRIGHRPSHGGQGGGCGVEVGEGGAGLVGVVIVHGHQGHGLGAQQCAAGHIGQVQREDPITRQHAVVRRAHQEGDLRTG